MNCEVAHERIVTAAYGELADEQAHELERHLDGCTECVKEREQLLALKLLMDAHPAAEPEANLIARARMRLEEALDALPPWRWYERLGQRMMNGFASLQAAPVAACLLLLAGGRPRWEKKSGREPARLNKGGGGGGLAGRGGGEPPPRRRLPDFPALGG